MSKKLSTVLLALPLSLAASQALAYIGPGAGISVVGSLLSILATFFVAVGAVLFWPVRKFLKRRRARREEPESELAERDGIEATGDDDSGD